MVVLRLINTWATWFCCIFFTSCTVKTQENLEAVHEAVQFCDLRAAIGRLKAVQKCWMLCQRREVNFQGFSVQCAHRKESAAVLSNTLENLGLRSRLEVVSDLKWSFLLCSSFLYLSFFIWKIDFLWNWRRPVMTAAKIHWKMKDV